MSYLSIAQCHDDPYISQRISACVASEGENPALVDPELSWYVASRDDIEAAYESALIAGQVPGPGPDGLPPGADPAVVTDGMILSAVQAFAAEHPPA